MHPILKNLRNGSASVEDRIAKVVAHVLENPELFENLFSDILHPNPTVRVLTAQVIDRVSEEYPELLQTHKNTLIYKVAKVEQPEIRYHVARMLPRLRITSREHSSVVSILASYLEDGSTQVRDTALRALETLVEATSFAGNDNEDFRSGMIVLLKKISKTGSPAIQNDSRKLLKKITDVTANVA